MRGRIILSVVLAVGMGTLPATAQSPAPAPIYKPKPKPGTREYTEPAYAAYKQAQADYLAACAKPGQSFATLHNAYDAIGNAALHAHSAAMSEANAQPQVVPARDEYNSAQRTFSELATRKTNI